jgi:acylphosphatase
MLMSVHLIAHGKVQGVWYRAGTREKALQLGLCGWAKNCPDGTVEIHAEGEKGILEQFINWCRKGSPTAQVSSLGIKWVESQGLTSFKIRPTSGDN